MHFNMIKVVLTTFFKINLRLITFHKNLIYKSRIYQLQFISKISRDKGELCRYCRKKLKSKLLNHV